jgi:cysteine desulfurase/selenocysteine lyase
MLNTSELKKDFPILSRQILGGRLVYLDNAATTQKPESVIQAEADFYRLHNANIHRGIHTLSVEATELYEAAREKVRAFINAKSLQEIIFVRNATEGLNLIAETYGRSHIGQGDSIVITEMEHHANLLPWQRLAKETGATLSIIPINDRGQLVENWPEWIKPETKMVTLPQMSNVLGTINPIDEIIEIAHQVGAIVIVDAAQSIPHMTVDVQDLDADFVVFSGHKMLGPTGIGVVYGRESILERLEPYQLGGEMIREVTFEAASWNDLPWKFEAGTPNIAGAIGLGAAIDYLQAIGMDNLRAHEMELTQFALNQLSELSGVEVYGPINIERRGGVISFNVKGIHAHDVASILDEDGVAIRSGFHCAQPLVERMGLASTARASFYLYNDHSDVDALISGIERVRSVFKL